MRIVSRVIGGAVILLQLACSDAPMAPSATAALGAVSSTAVTEGRVERPYRGHLRHRRDDHAGQSSDFAATHPVHVSAATSWTDHRRQRPGGDAHWPDHRHLGEHHDVYGGKWRSTLRHFHWRGGVQLRGECRDVQRHGNLFRRHGPIHRCIRRSVPVGFRQSPTRRGPVLGEWTPRVLTPVGTSHAPRAGRVVFAVLVALLLGERLHDVELAGVVDGEREDPGALPHLTVLALPLWLRSRRHSPYACR